MLDFSAYEAKWVHDAVGILQGKLDKDTGVYLYISSDSVKQKNPRKLRKLARRTVNLQVYEVSEGKTSQRRTLETDSRRPNDVKARKHLKAADEYGDAKLSGEEALATQREDGGFPWVALRFSDVIGPRDTTHRWYLYQARHSPILSVGGVNIHPSSNPPLPFSTGSSSTPTLSVRC